MRAFNELSTSERDELLSAAYDRAKEVMVDAHFVLIACALEKTSMTRGELNWMNGPTKSSVNRTSTNVAKGSGTADDKRAVSRGSCLHLRRCPCVVVSCDRDNVDLCGMSQHDDESAVL